MTVENKAVASVDASLETPLRILSDLEIDNLPDPKMLVRDLVQERSIALLYGPDESFKSFFALDLASSIGSGLEFHGRAVLQGNVVYVYAEGAPNLKHRLAAWKAEHGLAADTSCNVWFIPTSVDLTDDHRVGLTELIETIGLAVPEPVRLVVIDTLARCFGDKDENSTRDMNSFMNRCDVVKETFDCSVLVVHHTGWDEKRERGNRVVRANIETVIRCEVKKGLVRISCRKQKDADHFESFALRPAQVELEHGATSCILRSPETPDQLDQLDQEQEQVLSLLGPFGTDGATYSDWRDTSKAAEISERKFKEIRTSLVELGYAHGPPPGNSRGFKYTLTPKGIRTLSDQDRVQDALNPKDVPTTEFDESGPDRGHLQLVENQPSAIGSSSGPNGVPAPNARSGPGGGAYKAPLGPNAVDDEDLMAANQGAQE